MAEQDYSFSVLHLPLLGGRIELDVGGSRDCQAPQLAELDQFGVKPGDGSLMVDGEDGGHLRFS